jgi:hypothetical protein
MSVQSRQHKTKLLNDNTILCVYVWGNNCRSCTVASPKYVEFATKYNEPGKRVSFVKEDVGLGLSDCTAVPIFQIYIRGNPKYVEQVIGPNFTELGQKLDHVVKFINNPR